MLSNRTWDNLLVPNRITATDLYRIDSMFEQVKAAERKISSLFLTLGKLEDRDYGSLCQGQAPEFKSCEKIAHEIKLESAYLAASYESLKETIKEFHNQSLGNNFISDMAEIEGNINKVLEMVSLLKRVRQ